MTKGTVYDMFYCSLKLLIFLLQCTACALVYVCALKTDNEKKRMRQEEKRSQNILKPSSHWKYSDSPWRALETREWSCFPPFVHHGLVFIRSYESWHFISSTQLEFCPHGQGQDMSTKSSRPLTGAFFHLFSSYFLQRISVFWPKTHWVIELKVKGAHGCYLAPLFF